MGATDLLMVAGEASGDLHGARLLTELRRLRPELRAFGLGGDELSAAGLETRAHSAEISVVGITEVLKILSRAREIFADLLAEVERRDARVAVLIDFPDFNLRLAKALKKRGVRVLYYISPQVWAWRRRRVRTIARVVDKMLVVLPFEEAFYRQHGVEVTFVGHPLVDEVPELDHAWDRPPGPDDPFDIALLPGSRESEIGKLLPVMLESARRIAAELPARFRLIRAPTIPRARIDSALEGADLEVDIVSERRFEAIAGAHLALCASGTATLETGLLGTPMLVLYRVSGSTYLLARLLAHSRYASLVNLLLEREVVPELLQDDARPEHVCARAVALLRDRDRIAEMRAALAELRRVLGDPGASRRAAAEVARFLESA